MTDPGWWDQLYTAQLQFPNGGIWGNVFAAPLLAVAAAVPAWLLRHRIAGFFHGSLIRALERKAEQTGRALYKEVDEHLFADRLPDLGPAEGAPDEPTGDPPAGGKQTSP